MPSHITFSPLTNWFNNIPISNFCAYELLIGNFLSIELPVKCDILIILYALLYIYICVGKDLRNFTASLLDNSRPFHQQSAFRSISPGTWNNTAFQPSLSLCWHSFHFATAAKYISTLPTHTFTHKYTGSIWGQTKAPKRKFHSLENTTVALCTIKSHFLRWQNPYLARKNNNSVPLAEAQKIKVHPASQSSEWRD